MNRAGAAAIGLLVLAGGPAPAGSQDVLPNSWEVKFDLAPDKVLTLGQDGTTVAPVIEFPPENPGGAPTQLLVKKGTRFMDAYFVDAGHPERILRVRYKYWSGLREATFKHRVQSADKDGLKGALAQVTPPQASPDATAAPSERKLEVDWGKNSQAASFSIKTETKGPPVPATEVWGLLSPAPAGFPDVVTRPVCGPFDVTRWEYKWRGEDLDLERWHIQGRDLVEVSFKRKTEQAAKDDAAALEKALERWKASQAPESKTKAALAACQSGYRQTLPAAAPAAAPSGQP